MYDQPTHKIDGGTTRANDASDLKFTNSMSKLLENASAVGTGSHTIFFISTSTIKAKPFAIRA